MFGQIDWKKNLTEYFVNEAKYGGMFMKIQPPMPPENVKVNLEQTDPRLRPHLFYYGFECCMAGSKDPYVQYACVTGKKPQSGPEWGTFMEGWEMCMILRDGTDRDGVPLVKEEVAIIFDLDKLSCTQIHELIEWRLSNANDENWEEASWAMDDFPKHEKHNNYWLVCRNKKWTGSLLKWLIQQKFPDSSYRVVPCPNL